jgi:HK97 family phage prohead protease
MDGTCELERRLIAEAPGLEVKAEENGRTVIRGYAAVFESPSQDLGGFVEIVERGAFDDVIGSNPDVFGKYNHERVIGRTSSGTMRLMVDDRGLRYEIDPPKAAADVVELIERGDVRGSSFAFRVQGADESWSKDSEGRMVRRIKRFSFLGDAGPVDQPAYLATETYVSKRALEMAHAETSSVVDNQLGSDAPEERAVSMKPTAGMASAARRGLKLHEEGKSGDGLKPETVARANRLAKREEMNEDWIREMNAWFARHYPSSTSDGWDSPPDYSPFFVAFQLWGGRAAMNWSARKVKELDGERDLPEYDEERDVEEAQNIKVIVSASTTDFEAKMARLKAALLLTPLHGK